ncbi:MAG: glycoside hydrolase [Deferribacteres bacterium]|nr:glycoside hydrolase [Deferribacteres bacterium]
MRNFIYALLFVLVVCFPALLTTGCSPNKSSVNLQQNFQNPPAEARPRVWWHWMNGNITKEGIQKDLQWMQRSGIGGFQNFDANLNTPIVVEKKLGFMKPDWKDAFRFTTELADSMGLEMAIAGSPGWSESGGPWVEPKDGMKKYVWTTTRVTGGDVFNGKLLQPASTTGRFQNVALPTHSMFGEPTGDRPTYYHDALVVAYKLLPEDKKLFELNPEISSSGGHFNLNDLTDGDLNKTSFLPPMKVDEDMWVQYEFVSPQTFKAVSVVGANTAAMGDFGGVPQNRRLLISNDGITFKEIAIFTNSINPQNTLAFKPVQAKYWRFAVKTLPPPNNLILASMGIDSHADKSEGIHLAEFDLFNTDRIDQFEDKAGFTAWREDNKFYLESNADAIPTTDVVDLTDKMQADGSLEWQAPEGDWIILRFGYTLTGRQNHPASPEATGLEVDKLDKDAVRSYVNTYLDMYEDATGGLMGEKGLGYMILDSYEAGHMTWTSALPQEFKTRRGYEITSWMPVLTGRIVKSREDSEKFLWDFRKTIGELIAENHYDVIGEELHKRGMKRYTESHEAFRAYLPDGMDVKRNSDIPMSAMWMPGGFSPGPDEAPHSKADIRESASVAHIYGKPYVAAESMTSINNAFTFHPEKLKRTADMEMASGLNRFVIHTSVHQPLDNLKPGFSLGPFGQYFTRQETWAEQARPWIDYLARSCYMLQQGRFVADALVYYGENTNLTLEFREELPEISGYEYDFINSTALLEVVSTQDGKMITPGGGSYNVLVLHKSAKNMTLPVLKKIKELVDAGVTVTGTKPERTPSLSDDPQAFAELVDTIWSSSNVSDKPAAKTLKSIGVEEDVIISGNSHEILYVHRSAPGVDIYWLDNRSAEKNQAEISFRITGKAPMLWHPQTGETKEVSWKIDNGRTIVPLEFASWEAFFIVFKDKTDQSSHTIVETTEELITTVSGPWQVRFQNGRGAPESAMFASLESFSKNDDPGIKYFSGTVTYRNAFQLTALGEGSRVLLDLGEVKNLAEISVNGKNLGILWKTPFRMDITEAVKTGENTLEIAVTNTWVNRLIGDAQPGVKEKVTFTVMPFYRANSPLLPAGLLGDVKLIRAFQENNTDK